jgi:replicative DNA helicase
MSRDTGISIEAIQAASYSEHDVPRMMKAISDNHERPFYVWQAPGSSAIQIESKLRVMKAKFGIRLAIVDYLGLVQGDSKASVYERTTSNSQAFATMAKRLDLPILVLCQLNRLAEGEVPELHHLRDSGSIEQDADVVAFIHRDKRDSQEALFIAAKKRQGAIAQTYLNFQDGRFSDPNEAYTADFAKVVA